MRRANWFKQLPSTSKMCANHSWQWRQWLLTISNMSCYVQRRLQTLFGRSTRQWLSFSGSRQYMHRKVFFSWSSLWGILPSAILYFSTFQSLFWRRWWHHRLFSWSLLCWHWIRQWWWTLSTNMSTNLPSRCANMSWRNRSKWLQSRRYLCARYVLTL